MASTDSSAKAAMPMFQDATTSIEAIVLNLERNITSSKSRQARIGSIGSVSDDVEHQSSIFKEHKQKMLKTTDLLMENTKKVVVSCIGNKDDEIQEAVTNAVQTITLEADYVKLAATDLGSDDMEAQLLLLTAVKDVANALGDLIGATRAAAGKSHTDPAMEKLKSSAKTMVSRVSSLSKTIQNATGPSTIDTALEDLLETMQDLEKKGRRRTMSMLQVLESGEKVENNDLDVVKEKLYAIRRMTIK